MEYASVFAAATGPIDTTRGLVSGAVIDGMTLATGQDVLLMFQPSPADNGIYTVVASGAASRNPIYASYAALPGLLVTVQAGSVFQNTLWQCQAPPGGVLGSNAIPFAPPWANVGSVTRNVGFGFAAIVSPSGTENTALGYLAGYGITSGSYNVAVGSTACTGLGAGSYNVFIGRQAGQTAASNFCIGIGANALQAVTGSDNIAVGTNALQQATTATQNVAIGSSAMGQVTTSAQNVAIGHLALAAYTTGEPSLPGGAGGNVAIGFGSMTATTSSYENTAVGRNTLHANTTGIWHVAMGVEALWSNTTGSNNTAIGLSALWDNTTGNFNTGLGYGAGGTAGGANAQQTGSNNTYIGAQTGSSSPTQFSNMTCLGAQVVGALSNAVFLGRAGSDVVYAGETVLGPNSSATGNGAAARTVATLPAPTAALMGARSFVTDAASATPAFMSAVSSTGGGSNTAPVFCTGAAWVYG
jgi:hypothetical protein